MKMALIAVVALVAGGCATATSPELLAQIDQVAATAQPASTETRTFKIVDERSEDAADYGLVSLGWAGGFSCFLGVTQFGHSRVAADRLIRLENQMAAALPDAPAGSPLVVRRYDIYLNAGAEAHAANMNLAFGAAGIPSAFSAPDQKAPEIWRKPRCNRDKMEKGWFDSADLVDNGPPVVVEIDVSVLGKDYEVNASTSPALYGALFNVNRNGANWAAIEAVLQTAMDKANQRLLAAISGQAQTE